MALRIGTEKITRERGYLYYLGKDGRIWRTPTRLNRDGTKRPVTAERYRRIDGYMYFVDKAGFVSVAPMEGVGMIRNPARFRIRPVSSDEQLARVDA